jgi:hypothetical protein
MSAALGSIIPDESRLALYLSARYLQELEIALRLTGIRTRYERPGIEGFDLPRLCVEHPELGWMDEVICALPWHLNGPNPEWWFEWYKPWEEARARICAAKDMAKAAAVILVQLHEES